MTDVFVVLVTAPDAEKAAELGRTLVEQKLVACANVVPAVRSIYRWEGRIEDSTEALVVLKTPRFKLKELVDRITEIHPYEVPEVLAVPVEAGNVRYLDWVIGSVY
ncbi:MAG TPA: divalent-cation tolerance protein CutA [Anaeromyxobacteraceae bacterium]|nr:divalent-cation tolerance protein CutA [Anaeromyxobacteraceae bacterium]